MQRAWAVCSAGQGFGSAPQRKAGGKAKGPKQKEVNSGDSKAVQRAVRLVEEQEVKQQRGGAGGVRPVDPREATRGKVEYVKVKGWGSGAPEDLGSLQLESEATPLFEAGADDGPSGSSGASGSDGASPSGGGGGGGMPFHEVLARRLELLQSQGALGGLAQAPGGKPLPSFDRWAFAAGHYAEYLSDMHAVHAALEDSLAAAADAQRRAAAAAAAPARQRHERLLAALDLFGPEAGLARSAALLQDLQRLPAAGGGDQQQQQQAGGGQGPTAASQHAAAYAAYIASLARLCAAADGPEEEEQAVLRLLANAYIAYLQHLTSGGRIGAAASQRLGLAQAGALGFYGHYPLLPEGAKALERFVGAANRLGGLLSGSQQEALMQELPKAMTKSSQLLLALAREA